MTVLLPATAAAPIQIAVVAASYNRRDETMRAVGGVLAQSDTKLKITFYLLDDASTDGTASAVAAAYPGVVIIQGDGERFWGGGMYEGMRRASNTAYDFMLWLNDDVVLEPFAISELIRTYREVCIEAGSPLHIVTASLLNPSTGVLYYGGLRRTSSWHPTRLKRVLPEAARPLECDTMNGNLVLVPREVVHKIGFIDPAYRHQLGDIEYGYRARRAGAQIWLARRPLGACRYDPRPKSWQAPGISLSERLRRLNSPHGWPFRGWMRFMWRYGGALAVAAMLVSYARELAKFPRRRADPSMKAEPLGSADDGARDT